jgi:hypothetical protein
MKIMEAFIDLSVRGLAGVKAQILSAGAAVQTLGKHVQGVAKPAAAGKPASAAIGVTPDMKKIITEMAQIRTPFTKLQRAMGQIGGEMAQGIKLSSEVMRRTISRQLEPSMMRLQDMMVKQVAAARNLGPVGTAFLGWGTKVSTSLGKMNFFIERLQRGLGPVLSAATSGFYMLGGGILGFVTAGLAGTTQGAYLTFMFQQLSRQIAGVFMPYIKKLIDFMVDLVEKMRNLSGDQQDQILHWAEMGLAILGVAVIGGKLLGVMSAVSMAFQGLIALGIELNVLTGGILIVIGALVTAFAAWSLGTTEGRQTLKDLWDAFQPVIDVFREAAEDLLPKIVDIFKELAPVISAIVVPAVQLMVNAFTMVIDAIKIVIGLIKEVIDGFLIMDRMLSNIPILGSIYKFGKNLLGSAGDVAGSVLGIGGRSGGRDTKYKSSGADFKNHREPTLQASGWEAITASFNRIQQSALKTDFAKSTAENTEKAVEILNRIADVVEDKGGLIPGAEFVPKPIMVGA